MEGNNSVTIIAKMTKSRERLKSLAYVNLLAKLIWESVREEAGLYRVWSLRGIVKGIQGIVKEIQ